MQDAINTMNLAAQKLLRAEDDYEVKGGLDYLRAAMNFGIPPQAVEYFIRLMKKAIRDEAISHAQEASNKTPSLFPEHMPALFQEKAYLLAKFPDAGEWANVTEAGLRYSLNGLSICETAASVHDFTSKMYEIAEENGRRQDDLLQSLLSALKDEIIIDYMKAFDRLPERTPRQKYTVSLLAAINIIVHCGYPPNLLFYSKGIFEVITAKSLLKETGILRLRRKLSVMCFAMGDMEPEYLDRFSKELTWEIPQAVIRILKAPGVEEMLPRGYTLLHGPPG
jgi:hypothetical protein